MWSDLVKGDTERIRIISKVQETTMETEETGNEFAK